MHLCWPSKRHVIAAVTVLALAGAAAASPALADCFKHSHHHHHKHHSSHSHSHQSNETSGDDGETSDDTTTDGNDDQSVSGPVPTTGAEQTVQVQTTAYSFEDNQGGSNATICCGKLHKTAAGKGTFADPITLAVPGHGGSGMQTPAGTRVYFTKYHFYGIVEDSGATPKKLRRFDIWSDGRGNSSAEACMSQLTGTSTAILNASSGKSVTYVGPRSDAKGCHAN